ncbi:MAG: 6-carboxytetrahydropterin synthase [Anaerohalosphaera sp.]|nr:6-carboxytetrahydropterin synthase [Anaerohalosphaera sp.]
MYTVTIEKVFEAFHGLVFADGAAEETHSHDWVVRAAVSAPKLDSSGLAIDFIELSRLLEDVIEPLRGKKLEETGCFYGANASAEILAKYIYDNIAQLLPNGVVIEYTEVMEAPGCWAKYQR